MISKNLQKIHNIKIFNKIRKGSIKKLIKKYFYLKQALLQLNNVNAQVTSCYYGQTSSSGNLFTPSPVACSIQQKNTTTIGFGPYMCGVCNIFKNA